MQKKVILIMLFFVLMMNLLIGVIYSADENLEEQLPETVQMAENTSANEVTSSTKVSENTAITNTTKASNTGSTIIENGEKYIFGGILIFLVLLIAVERKTSIKIFIRLIVTLLILYFAYIKAIVNNQNIIIFTILITFLIAVANIFIREGLQRRSFSELISIGIVTLFTGVSILTLCIIIKVQLECKISFIDVKDATSIENIVFGLGIIALFGVYMDIISKITLRLDEEKDKAQDITWKNQFFEGVEIGKDIISEKINMLYLMFAGIILLPTCMYLKSGYSFFQVLQIEQIFFILMIAVIGNIGLVLSVPITAFSYAMFNRRKTIYKMTSENKIDGKRSLKL